jgi:hypothetical protein
VPYFLVDTNIYAKQMFKGGLVVQIENITFKVDTLANGGVSK